MFGYNQTLPVAVAANTRYRQLGFDGFEDYDFQNCSDNHFRLSDGSNIVDYEAHTGRKSIRVTPQNNLTFSTAFNTKCEDVACNLIHQITVTGDEKTKKTTSLVISGGVQPYNFDYQTLNGNVTVELSADGNSLIINQLQPIVPNQAIIRITITDAESCQKIIEL